MIKKNCSTCKNDPTTKEFLKGSICNLDTVPEDNSEGVCLGWVFNGRNFKSSYGDNSYHIVD